MEVAPSFNSSVGSKDLGEPSQQELEEIIVLEPGLEPAQKVTFKLLSQVLAAWASIPGQKLNENEFDENIDTWKHLFGFLGVLVGKFRKHPGHFYRGVHPPPPPSGRFCTLLQAKRKAIDVMS